MNNTGITEHKNKNETFHKKKRKHVNSLIGTLKFKIRKLEKELLKYQTKQNVDENTNSSFQEIKKELLELRKYSTEQTSKLQNVIKENNYFISEITRLKDQLVSVKATANEKINMMKSWKSNKKTAQKSAVIRKKEKVNNDEVFAILKRMDAFIEGGIREREELIRQIDRLRDRSVQSIRILEKEKAINLGLLETQKVNRKIADRVGVFVDVQNMFYAARQQFNGRLDFQRLLSMASQDRRLERAVAYIVETPDVDQSNFISLLNHSGYEVKSKKLRTRGDGSAKGNWDMEMAMDIISFIEKLDVVVLVSGDGDFVSLVKKIQDEYNVQCEIYGFEHNTAVDLKEVGDAFVPIGKEFIFETTSEKQEN